MAKMGSGMMKITNKGGRAWVSKYDDSGMTIHITNGEVEEFDVKGSQIVIKLKRR